ncbi:hypothetical protein ACJIZ3_019932 [Penstemon smallii]|uniref:CCHC-type domain-containing protein n=1 Tax=Penstemon smallii TaxID=265156 RepID=A0ABD3T3J1_9LAMI
MTIEPNIKSTLPDDLESAKQFVEYLEERFRNTDKSLALTLVQKLLATKYEWSKGIQNHVLEMTNLIKKLSSLRIVMDEFFLVSYITASLPYEYGAFQISYNTSREKWSLEELSRMLIQEETRLKQQGAHSVNMVTQGNVKHKKGAKKGNKPMSRGKEPMKAKLAPKKDLGKDKCHFCNKRGHYQKDCPKRKAWFEKNGIPYNPETSTK